MKSNEKGEFPDREQNKSIENNFTYHPPHGDQQERYEAIRAAAKELAYLFNSRCLPSREKSIAMTKLEEAVMWANAAIARNEKDTTEQDFEPGTKHEYGRAVPE